MKSPMILLALSPLTSCMTSLPAREPLFDHLEGPGLELTYGLELEEVQALAPSTPDALRVGVLPPIEHPDSAAAPRRPAWDKAERAALRAWGDRMRDEGKLAELVFLPALIFDETLPADGQSRFEAVQRAAALGDLDAVLVVHGRSALERDENAWSLLDLTIVGNWIFPGQEARADAIVETLLVDARTKYVYGWSIGLGAEGRREPRALIDPEAILEGTREAAFTDGLDQLDVRVPRGGLRTGERTMTP